MPNFADIKLISDCLLVAGIIVLSFRIMSSGTISGKTAQLMILEASLKGIIKDADAAGRTLNDELSRRQNQLERLLSDLSATENRISIQQQVIQRSLESAQNSIKHSNEAPPIPSFGASVMAKPQMERVAMQLNSTVDDVKDLARQIEVSKDEMNRIETRDEELANKPEDTRLGVLGGIKRQVQTL